MACIIIVNVIIGELFCMFHVISWSGEAGNDKKFGNCGEKSGRFRSVHQGPDLQKILCQTYDSAALTPDLRRDCELRAINKKS